MIQTVSDCIHCESEGLPCVGSLCPFRKRTFYICDSEYCNEEAKYEIDGFHFCTEHAKQYAMAEFGELPVSEMLELLEINNTELDG